MDEIIRILHGELCSLVVKNGEDIRIFNKKGVRDLEYLLDHEPTFLQGASIADKVIGKAAAGMVAFGRIKELYAEVLSAKAVPLLNEAGIMYTYGMLVDKIVIDKGDTRCHLEEIVENAQSPAEIVSTLRRHFAEMQKQK